MRVGTPSSKRRTKSEQRWLTYDQAARRADVSKRTVQGWAYSGDLEVTRISKTLVRIDIEVFDRFLAERRAS